MRFSLTADRSLPFEPRTEEMLALREQLRDGVRGLTAAPGEVLHAQFTGDKPAAADVENLLLYNVDMSGRSFAAAAHEGVRFELAGEGPGARYDYAITPRDAGFAALEPVRTLATIDARLPGLPDRLDRVWWAIKSARPEVAEPALARGRPFAVRVVLCAPVPVTPAKLVKPVLDGVVAALQAHTDPHSLRSLSDRVGARLGVDPDVIAVALVDPSRAVLGQVHKLLHPWGQVVQWSPGDEHLVAGELLLEPGEWAVRAEVQEVRRR